MTVHDYPPLVQQGDFGRVVKSPELAIYSSPGLQDSAPFTGGNGDAMTNDQACSVLRRNWRVQGLAETTIDKRLLLFRRVGGVNASYDTVMAYLAGVAHPNTRRTAVSFLRATFRLAVALQLVDVDPTLMVPKPKVASWAPNALSEVEVDMLQAVLTGDVADYFTLGLYAGLRACEIAAVSTTWLMNAPDGPVLRVLGKGGTDLRIPAHERVVALIGSKPAGRLFPDATARLVSKRCLNAFTRNGVDGGIHRARHTFAQRVLAASGGDLLVTRDLLRHASTATVQHYVSASAGGRRRALQALP